MRHARWFLLLVLSLGVDVSSVVAVEVQPPLENKVTQALEARVTAEFIDKPLEDAVAELCQIAKVPHRIDVAALKDEGVDPQSPITMKWKNARVATALTDVFRPLLLTSIDTPEWVIVTTQAKSDEEMDTRAYDVGKLVALMKPRLAPKDRTTGYVGCGFPQIGYSGGSSIGPGVTQTTKRLPAEPPEDHFIVERHLEQALIEMTSGQWEMVDGIGGTCVVGDGRLTIRQPLHVHREIFRLLTGLETMLATPNPPPQWRADVTQEDQRRREAMELLLDAVSPDPAATISLENWLNLDLAEVGLEFIVDHPALQDEGVDWNAATIKMTPGVSRRTLLKTALRELQLTSVSDSGRFIITTQAKADEVLSRVIYDVTQIPEARESSWITNFLQESNSGQWEIHEGVGGTSSTFGITGLISVYQTQKIHEEIEAALKPLRRPDVAVKAVTAERTTCLYPIPDAAALDDLQRLLPKLIDGADVTWPEGSIEKLGSSLVVRQTDAVHRRIDALVVAIHEAHKVNAAANPSPPATKTSARSP